MAGRKRRLHQSKHPFDEYPFEACAFGSWKPVDFIKIEYGAMSIHFADNHQMCLEKGPTADIRVRSRKATVSDCSCILRAGIDVCVLSSPKGTNDSDKFGRGPVWADAKISSIQRKPHESECTCQFFVNFYVHQGSLGAEIRTINKEIKVVGLNEISILQCLEHSSHNEDKHYRWASTEDCSTLPQTRMLLGKFLSDVSWLVVTSALKRVSFCARSVENKVVYQILGRDAEVTPLDNESHITVVNFKLEENGMVVPLVSEVVVTSNTKRVEYAQESQQEQDEASPSYNVEGLRRSKRRHVQPERYLGGDAVSVIRVGFVRELPYRYTGKDDNDDELSMPLARLIHSHQNSPKQNVESSKQVNKVNTGKEIIVYNRRSKIKEAKSGNAHKNEHRNQLAIVPHPTQGDPEALQHYNYNLSEKIARSSNSGHESAQIPARYRHLASNSKLRRNSINLINFEPHNLSVKSDDARNTCNFASSGYYSYGTPKLQRKGLYDMDDMDLGPSKWEGIHSSKGAQEKRYRPVYSRNRNNGEEKTYRDRTLNATAYQDLINSYLKNINVKPTNEEPPITDQWKQFQDSRSLGQMKETEVSHGEGEEGEEESELDMLWREFEVSLASCYLNDETEGTTNAASFAEAEEKPNKVCEHDFRLDEEFGIYCLRCGFVKTDIRSITPPFVENPVWHQEEKKSSAEDPEAKVDEVVDFNLVSNHDSPPDVLVSQENDNVWALIPELRQKLHAHQKKAFEFLWKNIAGSMEPARMESKSRRRGGCVVSHTPGAGKTFLIIAFLVSYLKLFPGKKPLVLAPKTTLYTWYKEFIKWEIPIPVYLIHGRRTYRVFNNKTSMVFPGMPKPTEDVKHVLDCLEKIQKWHSHPSVLIMGYTSFLTLMREDSKYAHRKYMAKVLRESPGLLVLDEGHNPRSTKSRLRKVLMKVHTELRILLSGTLFQNNFCEYFNTLCLARPKFAHEVLKALDPKYKRKKKGADKAHLIEARARKFFLETIAKKIDSNNDEERIEGLNMLKKVTNGFIDVYEAGSSDGLPGLQIYTLLMNTTDTQHAILKRLHDKMSRCNGYPLELELLITLGSIHPWLVKTAVCADKFFTMDELRELDKLKFDLKIGSKVRFVLSLIYRVVQKEKILIFCHNIAPVKLFLEYFEKYFKWQRGREVLVLTGELELFERGRVMDKFEEPGGASKILLASITACAEGISLTAASRVIMLDSEWNPSKTKQAIARAFRPGQQKMVYVYQLLVTGSLEEDKYRRTTWKEWVSNMIFSEDFVSDPSQWQAEKIEDDILREMVEEDRSKSFHMIMKNEKASTTTAAATSTTTATNS